MKDLYSFDVSEKDALLMYDKITNAYHAILKKLEIPYAVVLFY
jgi:prolyl-tRNA synthetase